MWVDGVLYSTFILQGIWEWQFVSFCSACEDAPPLKTALSVTTRPPNSKAGFVLSSTTILHDYHFIFFPKCVNCNLLPYRRESKWALVKGLSQLPASGNSSHWELILLPASSFILYLGRIYMNNEFKHAVQIKGTKDLWQFRIAMRLYLSKTIGTAHLFLLILKYTQPSDNDLTLC